MAAIPYHVAEAFVRGEAAHAGNFRSTGDRLYSYGLELASHATDPDGGRPRIVVTDLDAARKWSVTTARHVSAARAAIERYQGRGGTVEAATPART